MSEEQLMSEVKNGQLKRAGDLFDIYNKKIYHFFYRQCLDQDLSEDLTQNVFMRMIKYRSSYRAENLFKSWIYQIARNVFYDHISKEKKMPKTDIEMAFMIADTQENDDELLLKRSLLRLSEEDRELLVMSKYEGMKYEQIAEILDTSVSNVKVKVHRAIKKLRGHFFEQEDQ